MCFLSAPRRSALCDRTPVLLPVLIGDAGLLLVELDEYDGLRVP